MTIEFDTAYLSSITQSELTKDVDSDKVVKMIEIGGLFKHWEYLHPIPKSDFAVKDLRRRKHGVEEFTGLKTYQLTDNSPVIPVYDLDTKSPICPIIVVVGDDGVFRAINDVKEAEEILNDKNTFHKTSTKRLSFVENKWEMQVVELFEFKPNALLVGTHGVYAIDNVDPYTNFESFDNADFPCPLVFRNPEVHDDPRNYDQTKIETFPKRKQMYDEGDLGFPYSEKHVGGWQLTTANIKQTCAYDATVSFLGDILGVKLTNQDRSWYVGDERVLVPGLPLENTLTVLSELVEPYGVELDRVWVDPFVNTEELERFAIVMGWEASEIWKMYRERVPSVPAARILSGSLPISEPLITFSRGATATPSGHATYRHPRTPRPDSWMMALSYRRK